MGTLNKKTLRSRGGFTLVELLAVLAIIGILAAIVIPNVVRYMANARMTRAVSEVNNAETALIGVLSDTGRSNFRDMLIPGTRQNLDAWSLQLVSGSQSDALDALRAIEDFYDQFFYELLRQGRESPFIKLHVDPEVRQKIGTFYMDLGEDSWGERYHFWMGPIRGPVPLRSYRVLATTDYGAGAFEPGDPDFSIVDAYVYNQDAYADAQSKVYGQPSPDWVSLPNAFSAFTGIEAWGFPAPDELPVYIWSGGPNVQNDANLLAQMRSGADVEFPDFLGGGDDPNNWDSQAGWNSAPRS
jgi:prepilin-type N-terminal cleavage/methylation domain-containing protein